METRAEKRRRWNKEHPDRVKEARDKYLNKNRKLAAERTQIC